MPTFPTDPALPAVVQATECDPDFFNTFVDNINAIALALIDLIGGVADGNLDIDAAKGIKWGTVLKIYFSGGDIIIDDTVQITGGLDVGGTLTIDTVTDSGAGFITVQEDIVLAAGKYVDAPTGKFDVIDDSGAVSITVNESMEFAAGKYVDAPTGKFDVIDDSGAAQITFNESIFMAAGKTISADGTLTLADSVYITNALDIAGTLTVNAINDSGAAEITFHEHIEMAANKQVKTDFINDAGSGIVTFYEDVLIDDPYTLKVGTPPTYNVTNELVDRAYDANTVAIAELADVVGTMINDLIAIGLFQ